MKKYLAEGLGTFIFVLVAAGSVLANYQTSNLGMVGVALAHAFALAAVIYAFCHISGAHLNPAVTVAQAITGDVPPSVAAGYVVSQLIGSVVAALALKVIFPDALAQLYLGDTMLGANVSPAMGIGIEALFTFILTLVIYGAAISKKAHAGHGGLAVGMTLGFAVLIIGHLTMAGLNPARSFGPALVSAHWENHFVYWIGPLIGAIAAGALYHFAFERHRS